MLSPFFSVAMRAPARQRAFRLAVVVHLLLLTSAAWAVQRTGALGTTALVAQFLLVIGIVEGAFLIGWRLTQLPKSKALEFLLVSPLHPRRVFWAEALVGLGRLALVTLSGVPILALLVLGGYLQPFDVLLLLVMPFTWGAVTGIGLTAWAYENLTVRRVGEAVVMLGILVYLVVGVLAAENLGAWLTWLPGSGKRLVLDFYKWFHVYNPFGVTQYWMENAGSPGEREYAWQQFRWLELAALATVGLLSLRAAGRIRGHFHDRHYRPISDRSPADVAGIRNRPLAWWAIRRVTEYSGRVNLWLAGGFGVLYAAYIVAEAHWPPMLGRRVFQLVEQMGGLPTLATALVVLAAVPAAFQYGLWDSNAQDRCRRLELLLLTELEPRDYWEAAAAAAWRRGRGYFFVAVVLWAAAAWAGRMTVPQVLAATAAGVVLWGLYFALGFRAFSRGHQANGLGSLLTLGLPFFTYALFKMGYPALAGLLPPGSVYTTSAGRPPLLWLGGILLGGAIMLVMSRFSLAHCDHELRLWYDRNHGQKVVD